MKNINSFIYSFMYYFCKKFNNLPLVIVPGNTGSDVFF